MNKFEYAAVPGSRRVEMAIKEAAARVKINRLLENAGWRFFPEDQ